MTHTRLPIVAFLAFCCLALSMAQPLNGTKWKVKLVPADDDSRKAGAKEIDDTLAFAAAKFTSEAYAKQGFAAVEFQEDTRGLVMATFTVEAKSDTAGTAKWSGTATQDQIKGQVVITAKDGKVQTLNFQGEKIRN